MSNDWLKVEKVKFEKIPFIDGISFEYYKKNMRKSSSRKEYYSHIIICDCSDKEKLVEYWNDIVQDIAVTVQSNLQDMIQAVNIYCCFFISESVDEKIKQVIENDTYSSKKYIFDNYKGGQIDEKLHIIDKKVFSLDDMETVEVFDSEEPFFTGENGGFYQSVYYEYREKKPREKKQTLVKAVEALVKLLRENKKIDCIYKLQEQTKKDLSESDDTQDEKFYKLRRVTLNNYRSYKGLATYDFSADNNTLADFILIYSTNGLGKTSFFDGVEWALTGKINRLDDAVEENNYRGRVLRNLDAEDDEASYVEMEFDEDKKLCRTVKEYKNSDYGKGTLKGKSSNRAYAFGKNIVTKYKKWDDFILPHHKIDGVLSSYSAEERYNNWGAYFDPDNNIREQFKYLNSLWKTSEELLSAVKEEKEEAEEAKEKLSDEKESFGIFCGLIKKYRELNSEFLFEYSLDDMDLNDYITILARIDERKVVLCSQNIKWEDIPNELNNLINVKIPDFNTESIHLNQLKESYSVISKRVDELVEKNTLQLNKRKLEEDIKQENEFIGWMEKCKVEKVLLKINNYEQLLKDKKSNQILLDSIKRIIEEKEEELRTCRNNEKYIVEHNNIAEIKDNILNCLREIEELNIELKNNKKNNYDSCIKELEEEINKKIESIEKNESKKIPKSISEDSINILFENNPENVTCMELTNIQNNIAKYEKQYMDYKKLVDEQQKEEEIRGKIIDEVLDWVKLNEDKACPVCHKEFSSNEDLIEEILKNKSSENKEYSLKVLDISKYLEGLNKDKDRIIQQYNEGIEKRCSEIRLEIERIRVRILKLKSDKKGNEKKQNSIQNEILSKQIDCLKKYKFSEPYNIPHLDEWIKEKKKGLQDEIELLEQANNKLTKEIGIQRETYKKINGLVNGISVRLGEYENNLQFLAKKEKLRENNISTEIALQEVYDSSQGKKNKYEKCLEQTIAKLAAIEDRMLDKLEGLRSEMTQIGVQVKETNEKVSLIKSEIELSLEKISRADKEFNYSEVPEQSQLILYRSEIENRLETNKNEISFLEHMQSDEKVRKYLEGAKSVIEKSEKASKKFKEYKKVNTILKDKYQKTRIKLNEHLNLYFKRIRANDIYNRLLPHKVYTQVSFQIDIPEGGNPGLYVTAVNNITDEKGKKGEVVPEWFFSTGQLNALGFCIFLGRALSSQNKYMSTILIDDPLEHMDGINIIGFIDLIRSILDTTDYQIILSTHDYTEYQVVRRKLPREYYKSKYINIIEDVY